jgi:hypothetical protein
MGQVLNEAKEVQAKTAWQKFLQFFTINGTGRHRKTMGDIKWK